MCQGIGAIGLIVPIGVAAGLRRRNAAGIGHLVQTRLRFGWKIAAKADDEGLNPRRRIMRFLNFGNRRR